MSSWVLTQLESLADSTEPHGNLELSREQTFWERNFHYLTSEIISPPISLV